MQVPSTTARPEHRCDSDENAEQTQGVHGGGMTLAIRYMPHLTAARIGHLSHPPAVAGLRYFAVQVFMRVRSLATA